MFRPFIPISISFIIGIIIQVEFNIAPYSFIFTGIFLFLISLVFFIKDDIKKSFVITIILFCPLGALHLANVEGNLSPNRLENLVKAGKIKTLDYTSIIFVPNDIPIRFEDKLLYNVELKRVSQGGNTYDVDSRIQLQCGYMGESVYSDTLPEPGDICRAVIILKKTVEYRNGIEGRFSDYKKRNGIYYKGNLSSVKSIQILKKRSLFNPIYLSKYLKSRLGSYINSSFKDEEDAGVIKAITLGIKTEELYKMKYRLRMSGLFHITAVSGLHVGMITISALFLFKWIGVSLRRRYVYTILIITFFCFGVGGYPSVVRATIMATLYLTGRLLCRRVDFLNIIALTCLIILFMNPRELFAPGFQYTFIVTIGIYLALKYFTKEKYKGIGGYLQKLLIISISAFVVALPLSAYHFNQVTPISIINNIIIIPIMFLVLDLSMIFLLLSFLQLPITELLAPIISLLLDGVNSLSIMSLHIPGAAYRIPHPDILIVVLCYLVIIWFFHSKHHERKISITLIFVVITVATIGTYPFKADKTDNLEVHFLDVGQGESIFIQTPEGRKILIDAGGFYGSSESIGEKVVSRFLWSRGIKKLDILILTHAHYDHAGGMGVVARNFKINEFWENGLNAETVEPYEMIIDNLPSDCERKVIRQGFMRDIGSVRLICLWPQNNGDIPDIPRNNDSLVLLMRHKKIEMLFTGDIEGEVEQVIVKEYGENLNVDVLKVAHHGSSGASTIDFLKTTSPGFAVISVGAYNYLGLPHKEVIERLQKNVNRIFRTDQHGRICMISTGYSLNIRTIVGNM